MVNYERRDLLKLGLVLTGASLLPSSSLPFNNSKRFSLDELEGLYLQAVEDKRKRKTFVEVLEDSITVPDYVDGIIYADDEGLGTKDIVMDIKPIENSFLDRRFVKNGPNLVRVHDIAFNPQEINLNGIEDLICTLEHEFRHAKVFGSMGLPIIEDAINKEGSLNLEVFGVLLELDAYGFQLKDNTRITNGLVIKTNVSKGYIKKILLDYKRHFDKLKRLRFLGSELEVDFDKLLHKYYLPHLEYLHVN